MISITVSNSPFRRKINYFSAGPALKSGLLDIHKQCYCSNPRFGFKRAPKFTKLINLDDPNFEDFFCRTTRYHIKKAKSEGVKCCTTSDLKSYALFYNEYMNRKKMPGFVSEEKLGIYGEALVMRAAYLNEGQFIVFHSYLLDKTIRRVRLLNSFSGIHDTSLTTDQKSAIGRANKFLHCDDMKYFRDEGFTIYDFGGYSMATNDKSLNGINNFKDSFGGILVEESDYESYIIISLRLLKNIFKHIKDKLAMDLSQKNITSLLSLLQPSKR